MKYFMGFCLLAAVTVSFAGCETAEKEVPAKANVEEVQEGISEEVERQNQTMEGHGEVDVDPAEQAKETAEGDGE